MMFRNLIAAIVYQGWRNLLLPPRNGLGIFSSRSHLTRTGKTKVKYNTAESAKRRASKSGVGFEAYRCAFCDGYHIGRNR